MVDAVSSFSFRTKLVLAFLILVSACWVTWTVTDSRWQSIYDKQNAKYADASSQAQAQARAKELQYDIDIAKANADGAKRQAEAELAVASSSAAAGRLHERLNALLTNTSTEATGTGLKGRTPNETINMLTDVFGKSVERNRQLAKFADQSWNAAKQCYDSYYATQ